MKCVRIILACIMRFFCKLFYGSKGVKIPPITDSILKEAAVDVAKKIRNKETTSVQVLEACIRRIKEVNSALNCFIDDRFEEALKEAKEADALIQSGTFTEAQLEQQKPFLGVPFTTKDSIAVKGLLYTAGLVSRKNVIAEQDAVVIRLLREKGAIIIGLTNVPEVCMWWETYNQIFGRTKNPYNTTRIVGGSSGGEGALQAAAGSVFGIGSDIGGSIRMPSFFNGIFGHKPSAYLVSNEGQYPASELDIPNYCLGLGPMTRHAKDLLPILQVISGQNISKLKLHEKVDVTKLKYFYQHSFHASKIDAVDPDIVTAMKEVIEYLNKQYGITAEEKNIGDIEKYLDIWDASMKDPKPFGELIMDNASACRTILEILKNAFGLSRNTFPSLVMALLDYGGIKYGDKKYQNFMKEREELEKTFKEMLGDNGVLLFPTHPQPAPYHNEPIIKPVNFAYTAIINCVGLPATAIPLGLNKEGLPIGIQVISNHNNDRLCLAVAEELDRAFGGWIEPQKS